MTRMRKSKVENTAVEAEEEEEEEVAVVERTINQEWKPTR